MEITLISMWDVASHNHLDAQMVLAEIKSAIVQSSKDVHNYLLLTDVNQEDVLLTKLNVLNTIISYQLAKTT